MCSFVSEAWKGRGVGRCVLTSIRNFPPLLRAARGWAGCAARAGPWRPGPLSRPSRGQCCGLGLPLRLPHGVGQLFPHALLAGNLYPLIKYTSVSLGSSLILLFVFKSPLRISDISRLQTYVL